MTSSNENNNFDSKQLQETIKIALEMKNTEWITMILLRGF